jgi:hypothetical protein
VGFPAINTFVGFAKGTKVAFNLLDKPERGPLLFFASMAAHRTLNTELSQVAIPAGNFSLHGFYGNFSFGHLFPSSDCAVIRYYLFKVKVYQ